MTAPVVSSRQLVYAVYAASTGPIICLASPTLIATGGRDAWLAAAAGGAVSLSIGLALVALIARLRSDNVFASIQATASRPVAVLCALLYIALSINAAGFTIRFGSEVLITGLTPVTPVAVYVGGFAVLAGYVSLYGLEVTCRAAEEFGIVTLAIFVVMILMGLQLVHWSSFLPVLFEHHRATASGAWSAATYISEWILVAIVLVPRIQTRDVVRASLIGGGISVISLILAVMTVVGAFGPTEGGRLIFGYLHVMRQVRVMEVVRGIESIFLFPWIMSIYIKSALHVVTATVIVDWLLGTNNGRLWSILVSLLTLVAALLPPSQAILLRYNLLIVNYSLIPFIIVITLLLAVHLRSKEESS